jgi:DNA-binding transcriptional ArsR family regulator
MIEDNKDSWNQAVDQLKALADPLRLRLMQELVSAPRTVTELAIQYKTDVGGLSHHLGVLFRVGLVERSRQGRFVEYRIGIPFEKPDPRRVWLDCGRFRIELPN